MISILLFFDFRDELAKLFPLLCHDLNYWVETTESSRQCQDLLQDRHQQLALVKEAQAMGRNHVLYSVVKRYNSFKRARDAHEKAKTGLKEKIEECEKQINMHNVSFHAIDQSINSIRFLSNILIANLDCINRGARTSTRTMADGVGNLSESRGSRSV